MWRKAWADFANDFLERNGSPERIDHRSNAERGIDEIPAVHMGVAACQMEKKGIATEKGELNRNIQKANRLIREIRAQIGKLKEWIADLFKARETAPEQPPQSPNLANLLMKYLSAQREKSRKYSQRLFAPTRSLSQLITSFIASVSLGIRHTPFLTFFTTVFLLLVSE